MPKLSPIQKLLSQRTQALLSHPQGMGNYFTFKTAIDILGLNWNDVAPGGVYSVTGKGYYDMGLAELATKRPFTSIGVAFEAQRVERIPVEEHDWRLDWVVTEAGLRAASPRPRA